ncbi:MAG: tetratricopeptide repeat protein [Desulfohalobiaceae bacterium]|nr:tetratricopeptide repeat protein [Desulfohalobiaceae bacterium]
MSTENGSEQPERGTAQRLQDEISSEVAPAVRAVTENIKLIGLVLGAIVLIAAGISGYKYYRQYTLETGQERVESILSLESQEERMQAIEDYLPQAPQRFKQGLRLELADLAMKQQRFERAAQVWAETAQNSQKEEIRSVARLGRAKALLQAGRSEKALALLQDLAENAPEAFQRSVYFELAAAAESEGEWEQALAAYKHLKSQTELGGERGSYFQYKISRLRNKIDNQASRKEQTEKESPS